MKEQEILDVLAGLRDRFACFHDRLRWNDLKSVLENYRITVRQRPLRREHARLIVMGGEGVMSIKSGLAARYWTRAAAHEFAHYLLHAHHDEEIVYQLRACAPDDPRELEAQYLADLMVLGPYAEPAPQLQRPILTTPAPVLTRAVPAQRKIRPVPLFDPYADDYKVGVTVARPTPRHAPFLETRREQFQRLHFRRKKQVQQLGLVFEAGQRWFIDAQGWRWALHDVAIAWSGQRVVRREVALASPDAAYRYFIGANAARRMYRFTKSERHDVSVGHLDRQLREAITLSAKTRAG